LATGFLGILTENIKTTTKLPKTNRKEENQYKRQMVVEKKLW